MASAVIATVVDQPWLHLVPLNLGDVSARGREPDRYVLVEGHGWRLRCDIRDGGHVMYEDARIWGGLLIIGYAARLYCVDLATQSVKTHELAWYFQSIHLGDDCCLVSSAQELLRIDQDGSIRWAARDVGLDGVEVDGVEGDIVSGQGEWDPPGGLRPFEVLMATGEILKAG